MATARRGSRRGRHGPGSEAGHAVCVRSTLDDEQGDELVIASLDAPSGDLSDVERLSIDSMTWAKASKARQQRIRLSRGPDFCGQRPRHPVWIVAFAGQSR